MRYAKHAAELEIDYPDPGNEDVSGPTSESILNYQLSILNS